MRPFLATLTLAIFAGALGEATPALAQDNSATVEALFTAGKKLMTEGKVSEACPKFLASYNLDHRLGTLLNLADCYEQNGQLASGWARFVEASTLAQRANQPDRATFASDHAKELEARLSTLVIAVPAPAPGLTITRDGVPVDPGAFGVAVAVDGGKHTIAASAPGKTPWSGDIDVKTSNDHGTLGVPPLVAAPEAPPQRVSAAPASEGASPTRKYVAIATAGVGVVAIGVGAAFGAMAISKNHSSSGDCGLNGNANDCNQAGVDLRQTAFTDGTLSTVFIGVGAAAVVGGVVLWLTGRPSGSTTVGFDGRSVQLAGHF
jgi:hypothetical protein